MNFIACAKDSHAHPSRLTVIRGIDGLRHWKEVRDQSSALLLSQETVYSPSYRQSEIVNRIYAKGKHQTTQKMRCVYNDEGKIEQLIRMPGTRLERIVALKYDTRGRLISLTWPSGVSLYYHYDGRGFLDTIKASDGSVHYHIEHNDQGILTGWVDLKNNLRCARIVDAKGRLIEETFPSGDSIQYGYDNNNLIQAVRLARFGSVQYTYKNNDLCKVSRYSPYGEKLYSHTYERDKAHKNIVHENIIFNLGTISRRVNDQERTLSTTSHFAQYKINMDPDGLITSMKIDNEWDNYQYDDLGQVLLNDEYDAIGNPLSAEVNDLNELNKYQNIECEYDLNGHLIFKKTPHHTYRFNYDALGRLVSAQVDKNKTVEITYDVLNRRLSKTIYLNGKVRYRWYLYQDNKDVMILDENYHLLALRVLGLSTLRSAYAISFEKGEEIYAPIYDPLIHVRKLINAKTHEVINYSQIDPFGQELLELSPVVPWIFASKFYDADLHLVEYNSRFYDPSIRRWITPDLIEEFTTNPYRFGNNNPLQLEVSH